MFQQLFRFIRVSVRNAILGGIQDASQEIQAKLEAPAPEPLLIEATVTTPAEPPEPAANGKAPARRKATAGR